MKEALLRYIVLSYQEWGTAASTAVHWFVFKARTATSRSRSLRRPYTNRAWRIAGLLNGHVLHKRVLFATARKVDL